MLNKSSWAILSVFVCNLAVAERTSAQGLDTIGNRAAGLAAFVAVADDASAVVWNPAGLVTGPIFNISLDLGRSTSAPDGAPAPLDTAGKLATTLIAAGMPPLGLSYYRTSFSSAERSGPAVTGTPGRENSEVLVRTLVTSHLGVTVLQSLGDYLIVGATAKLVHGRVGAEVGDAGSWDEALDRADMIDADSSIDGDIDVGVMLAASRVRAGVVVRNVTEPAFDNERRGVRMSLERHARAGVAWGDRWPGAARTVVAFDVDLTRVRHANGERRDVAVGAERWLDNRRIGVRGGVRGSTVGEVRPVATAGVSYALRAGTYVDAFVARGAMDERAWGVGARLMY